MQIVTHHGNVSRVKLRFDSGFTLLFYFPIRFISAVADPRFVKACVEGVLARVDFSIFYPIMCIFLGVTFVYTPAIRASYLLSASRTC